MKAMKIVVIGLMLVGLLVVAGCTQDASPWGGGSAPSGPVGGGCGVAPAAEVGVAGTVASESGVLAV